MAFVRELSHANTIAKRHRAWPEWHPKKPPQVFSHHGPGAWTRFWLEDFPGPARMQGIAVVSIGEQFLDTSFVAQQLLSAGFSREQVLVQTISHEAYHSNEGQRLQRAMISRSQALLPFLAAVHPDMNGILRTGLLEFAQRVDDLNAHRMMGSDDTLDRSWTMAMRGHTRINEGAADIFSMRAMRRAYPHDAARYLAVLGQARDDERTTVDSNPAATIDSMGLTYDNGTFLKEQSLLPQEHWPDDQRQCTLIAIAHALPFLRQNPLFEGLDALFSGMERALGVLVPTLSRMGERAGTEGRSLPWRASRRRQP